MTVLTTQQRLLLRSQHGSRLSARRDSWPLTKAQTDAAIAAVDDWVEANSAAYNSALPLAARNGLTALQKAELLYLVTLARFGG